MKADYTFDKKLFKNLEIEGKDLFAYLNVKLKLK
jgi:hypothetical protein